MAQHILMTLLAASLLVVGATPPSVHAENAMNYRLLSAQEAKALPRNRGSLGMDVERSQEIVDGGMTFDIIRIKQVRQGSPGAQAGFRIGDQIIAVDGRVFPTLVSFAAYIGALPPGTQAAVDYIPVGGGPAQAQRVPVTVGASGSVKSNEAAPSPGLSTGNKIAIGVGAVALLGCYEMGCFSHRSPAPAATPNDRRNRLNNPPQ